VEAGKNAGTCFFHPRGLVRPRSNPGHLAHARIDPIHDEIDARPNSWVIGRGTAAAPRRGTVKRPLSIALAHQGTTAVTLASVDDVIAVPALCAQHAGVNLGAGITAAIIVRPGRHRRLMQDIRLRASSSQGAPARDPTRRSSSDVSRWQACRSDTIVEVEVPVHFHQGEVVGKRPGVITRVTCPDIRSTVLLVAASLPGLPLTSDHGETCT